MEETLRQIQNHRSIRFYKDRPVAVETRQQLMETMNASPTSNGLQAVSVVRITDRILREELAKVAKQAYLAEVPELLIFLVDWHRNAEIAKAKGYQGEKYRSMDYFFQGVADVYIQAQSLVIAAESLGLGTVYFGSILNDSARVIELLKLPDLTFPLVGVGYGYPDDQPPLKPRMPIEFKLSENYYRANPDYLQMLADYDKEMTQYYDTRNSNQRVDSFTNQVKNKIAIGEKKRAQLMQVVSKQGFNVMLEDGMDY
ncbi:NADPH-dependent oxidoreductase [Facklamia sp. P12945]|uniref:NADPH-dependent oxidoreductase n=1 Tax=unclassified Facklamia TaxID=2622293 RepID=UPI003D1833E1